MPTAVMDEEAATKAVPRNRPDVSTLPVQWRRAKIKAMPVSPNAHSHCLWVVAPTGVKRHFLNAELPTTNHTTPPLPYPPDGAAICPTCGHGFSELLLAHAQGRPQTQCSECRWDALAMRAIEFQEETGIYLGVSNHRSDDARAERYEQIALMHDRAFHAAQSNGGNSLCRMTLRT